MLCSSPSYGLFPHRVPENQLTKLLICFHSAKERNSIVVKQPLKQLVLESEVHSGEKAKCIGPGGGQCLVIH